MCEERHARAEGRAQARGNPGPMSDKNSQEAIAKAAARRKPKPKAVPTPVRLRATSVKPTAVGLQWKPVQIRGHAVAYDVFRDGRPVGVAHHPLFDDTHARPRVQLLRPRIQVGPPIE